jgi:hypothetical protein
MRFSWLDVRWRLASGWVCKPEVAGSIPARSIKILQIGIFVASADLIAIQPHGCGSRYQRVKAARSRKYTVAVAPAEQAGVHRVSQPDCRDFPT